jgi:hypothetical protein
VKRKMIVAVVLAGLSATLCEAGVVVVPVPAPQLRPDQVCVSSTAKVGDAITNRDGDVLTLTDIHGWLGSRSSPCEGELSRVAEASFTESPGFHPALTWALPVGFRAAELSVRDRMSCIRLRAVYQEGGREIGIVVRSWDRSKAIAMDSMTENIRSAEAKLKGVTQSPVASSTVGGLPAKRWEVHWKGKLLAPDAGVTTVLFQGAQELVQIAVAGPDKLLDKMSADLARFMDSIQGIQAQQAESSSTADNTASDEAVHRTSSNIVWTTAIREKFPDSN